MFKTKHRQRILLYLLSLALLLALTGAGWAEETPATGTVPAGGIAASEIDITAAAPAGTVPATESVKSAAAGGTYTTASGTIVLPSVDVQDRQPNRFNVMMVLDASLSMDYSDRFGYRYDAVSLFNNLLPESGNTLGGVVFSTRIDAETGPKAVNGAAEKAGIVRVMKEVTRPGGWTNIGLGLRTALKRLEEKGDENLPSVIILLSDGNTAMISDELTRLSAEIRDKAVQEAAEKGIPIYTVCLNCNGFADVSEMKKISGDTGGEFAEIRKASDLTDVYQMYYQLIYGSTSVTLADGVFPQEGYLDTPFTVPGFGVEEVNIVFQGNPTAVELTRPDGSQDTTERLVYGSFSTIKVTDCMPGEWGLRTSGLPGDKIRIEVIYNADLEATLYTNREGDEFDPIEPVTFNVRLSAGDETAATYSDYLGFEAELICYDEYGEEISREPMVVGDTGFEASSRFDEGVYTFVATVTGNCLYRESEPLGPIRFAVPEPEPTPEPTPTPTPTPKPTPTPPPNTAPSASMQKVSRIVPIWPVVGGKLSLNLNTVVSDREDASLRYTAASKDFAEGTEYHLSPTGQLRLTLGNFRLRGGSVVATASDSEGLSCNVTVTVTVINAVVILLGLLAVGLIALLVRFLQNREPAVAIRGEITLMSVCGGEEKSSTPRRVSKKGKYPLSHFDNIDNVGLDYSRCYFEGGGDGFIFLVTDRNVQWRGYETGTVRIDSGAETTVVVDEEADKKLKIRYQTDRLESADSGFEY